MTWKWLIVLFLLLFLVIFATQNYGVVNIRLLMWSFTTSKAIVIFSAFILGALFGWITSFLKRNRKKQKNPLQ